MAAPVVNDIVPMMVFGGKALAPVKLKIRPCTARILSLEPVLMTRVFPVLRWPYLPDAMILLTATLCLIMTTTIIATVTIPCEGNIPCRQE